MEYMDNNFTKDTAKQRYSKLTQNREHFLDRAEECSELTIPSLIKPEGFTSSDDLYNPFQSVGARGVNNLASKLLLLLLPPNSPFFRLSITGDAKKELEEKYGQVNINLQDGSYEEIVPEVEAEEVK